MATNQNTQENSRLRSGVAVSPQDNKLSKRNSDAGYDLYPEKTTMLIIDPWKIEKVHTGVYVRFPRDVAGFIKERSGFPYRGVPIRVCGGVIDAGYTGELVVMLQNVSPERIILDPGVAVAQLVLVNIYNEPLRNVTRSEYVESFSAEIDERGTDGFGSTDGC